MTNWKRVTHDKIDTLCGGHTAVRPHMLCWQIREPCTQLYINTSSRCTFKTEVCVCVCVCVSFCWCCSFGMVSSSTGTAVLVQCVSRLSYRKSYRELYESWEQRAVVLNKVYLYLSGKKERLPLVEAFKCDFTASLFSFHISVNLVFGDFVLIG